MSEESEKESKGETTQRGVQELYQKNAEAGENHFVWNPAADW